MKDKINMINNRPLRKCLHYINMRSISARRKLRGLELATKDENAEIKTHLASKKKLVQYKEDQIFFNLNADKFESETLAHNYPQYKDLQEVYGFTSPAALEIDLYVKLFMTRYEKSNPELKVLSSKKRADKLKHVREGLISEKTFDLILQNMALPHNYPEPLRDWRTPDTAPFSQATDFVIPGFGKVEVKSVTDFWYKGKFEDYRVNVNLGQFEKNAPDYVVALWQISSEYVMLCGAMSYESVSKYMDGKYHVHTDDPFLSIPLEHFMNSIPGGQFYEALCEVQQEIVKLAPIKIVK
jgi:hypothetical protein